MTKRICKAAAGLVFLWCLVTFTSAFNWQNRSADLSLRLASGSSATKPAEQQRATLTLAERVAYQRAIEEVYWRHRIWPKENSGWDARHLINLFAAFNQFPIEQCAPVSA